MDAAFPLLSVLIWLPMVGGMVVAALGEQKAVQARLLALAIAVLTFAFSTSLFTGFDRETAAMQFVEDAVWIERFSIHYLLGVDGFSVPLILLTTFFGVLVVVAGWDIVRHRVHQYMASFLVMEGLMVGEELGKVVASLMAGDINVAFTSGVSVLGAAAQGIDVKMLTSISSRVSWKAGEALLISGEGTSLGSSLRPAARNAARPRKIASGNRNLRYFMRTPPRHPGWLRSVHGAPSSGSGDRSPPAGHPGP